MVKRLLIQFVLCFYISVSLCYAVDFGVNPLWDDGLAEVAIYDSKTLVYGKLRDHEKVLVTVKEDFNTAYYTKADFPYGDKELFPVLKLNIFTRIETENYPYHYLTSVFVKKEDVFYPLKMTISSQEWCGNTFKEWRNWSKTANIVYHSYWDNQGDGNVNVDYGPGNLLQEQLFVSLRALPFRDNYHRKYRLYDSLTSNKFVQPTINEALIRVSGPEDVKAIGKDISCWRVLVEGKFGRASYWFGTEYPHTLIKYLDSKGQDMLLKKLERRAYWN